jgi:hypothetical protein
MYRKFHFCAALAAVASLLGIALAQPAAAENDTAEFDFKQGADTLTVRRGSTPVARYMHAFDLDKRKQTYKPFLQVMEPNGEQTITKGVGGRYTHHRGVFRGWSKLTIGGESYDTWHMGGVVQRHVEFAEKQAGPDRARFTSAIRYQKDAGQPLLHEKRTFTFHEPPEPAYAMFDVTSTVEATEGALKLHGDPEHAGLQFRAANDIDTGKTYYVFSRDNARPKSADDDFRWVAMSFVIDDDERYTVLYLKHPKNPGETDYSAYRNYGRFGAWFPHTLDKGETSTTRVRMLIFEGDPPDASFMHEQYNAFAGTDSPTPETTVRGK